ncbi:MAG: tellurium resistance protein [Rhodobacteraceae bacterium CG17_big_fil_post_rev_8_21_14_2_50_63_15]|nr:TrgA family protein [Roseovarius sp.]PIV77888.1 MAG: tellurium resistance protein [Rhodobacteraceae bacterium CG17_big_fil_post_rev_8_21_14_2_50_63_15]
MPVTDNMPTTAKLVAAIGLGIVGWVGSDMIRPLMPADTSFGWFNYVNLVLGALCGWVVTGKRVGFGWAEGFSAGLTGVGALVVWGLFAQSFAEMLSRSLDRRYTGPVEGLTAMVELAVEFGTYLLNGPLIGFLCVGGILTGLVAEWVARRWS